MFTYPKQEPENYRITHPKICFPLTSDRANSIFKSSTESMLQVVGTRTARVKLGTAHEPHFISDLKNDCCVRIIGDKDRELALLARLVIKRKDQPLDEGLTNGSYIYPDPTALIDYKWTQCSSPAANLVDNTGEYVLQSPPGVLYPVYPGDEIWSLLINPNWNAPWMDATQQLNLFHASTWISWYM